MFSDILNTKGMRLLISILIILVCSCSSQDRQIEDKLPIESSDSTFGVNLINSNFLIYADSSKLDTLTDQIIKAFNIYDEGNHKILHVDAEELAEFQFNFFLPQLNVILSKRNFQLSVKKADNYETSHEVFLNGEKIQLYTKDEMEKENFWDISSRTFFKKINELLNKQNSNESFFLLYNGNDLHALLLTDVQFGIIANKYKNEPKEIPYKP